MRYIGRHDGVKVNDVLALATTVAFGDKLCTMVEITCPEITYLGYLRNSRMNNNGGLHGTQS